jgi:hypothetical protein
LSTCNALASQAIGPGTSGVARLGWVGAKPTAGKLVEQRLALFRSGLEIPENVLNQNDSGIDNNAEIDRTDGQKIGVLAPQHQDDDAEE